MKKISFVILCAVFMLFAAENRAFSAGAPLDMVFVPSGYSMMGTEYGDLSAGINTKPYHLVFLDAFYMDKYEVTNADYAVCVAAGACSEPKSPDSKTRENYYSNPMFGNFPVINVTWQDAVDYCAFVDKRLPTEAEWERAARGKDDNRRYPWGNGSPRAYNLNITLVPGDTEQVNNYVEGQSPYGIADMLGNVAEWVSDWYDENVYQYTDKVNPQGPVNGTEKVIRGTSFETGLSNQHTAARAGYRPDLYSYELGFRCAKTVRTSVSYETAKIPEGPEPEFFYVKAGNENGIFLIAEPGTGYDTALIAVVPNGALLEVVAGPVSINYSQWYQVRTQRGESGWTIANSIVPVDDPL